MAAACAFLGAAVLAGCSASVPTNPEDACAIFREKRGWFDDCRDSYKRWGVPISVQLAFVYQESRFRAKARPPRRKILWIFPGPRPSSAFGYSQALDGTWDEYRHNGGRRGADRDDFEDSVDFIGWYVNRTARRTGLSKRDAYSLYLAYHEGDGGFRRRTYRGKPWLTAAATRVRNRSELFRKQLVRCQDDLERGWFDWLWPF